MKIVYLNPEKTEVLSKKMEVLKFNGKNYIEFADMQNFEYIVELALSLAKENEALKERLNLLEGKFGNQFHIG